MPCLGEMPDLVEVGRDFAERGGLVIAVSQDLFAPGKTLESSLPKVEATMERLGMRFPVVVFDGDLDELNERFDLPGPIPATIAIGRSGEIVDRQDDVAHRQRLVEMMERALRE